MDAYLRAARCIPPLSWCDWEALKIAVLLDRNIEALEAAQRLSARAPITKWEERETTPGRVADVIARIAHRSAENKGWVRILDALVEQATDEEDHAQAHAVRRAVLHGDPLPPPRHFRQEPVLPPGSTWESAREAYIAGQLRDDDMLLDAGLRPLFEAHEAAELLAIRRDF
jgi:hypothetical protein